MTKKSNSIAVTLDKEAEGLMEIQVESFVSFVNAGLEYWRKAGELLVQMLHNDPLAFKKIMRQCPSISMDILVAFERIGRKQVFPKLLLDPSPGSRRLLTLPYEMQERYCAEKVKVLLQWRPGNPNYIEKHVQSLTSSEVEQVFGVDGARTLEQQHEFHASKHQPQPKMRAESRRGMSSNRHDNTVGLKSCGYYKIVMKSGEPTLVKMDGDFPYAIPVELIGTDDSEPFEIINLVR